MTQIEHLSMISNLGAALARGDVAKANRIGTGDVTKASLSASEAAMGRVAHTAGVPWKNPETDQYDTYEAWMDRVAVRVRQMIDRELRDAIAAHSPETEASLTAKIDALRDQRDTLTAERIKRESAALLDRAREEARGDAMAGDRFE